jgi:hypothetical protein
MTPTTSFLFRTGWVMACALSGASAGAQTAYEQDRAACLRSDSQHERTSCLREAGAVRAQGQNRAPGATPEARMENAMKRCAELPPENQSTCERMVRGEGTVSGSVAGGGQIRELVTPVPAVPPMQPMPPGQPSPQPLPPLQPMPGAPAIR